MSNETNGETYPAVNGEALKALTESLSLLFMATGDLERLVLRVRRQARDLGYELAGSERDR